MKRGDYLAKYSQHIIDCNYDEKRQDNGQPPVVNPVFFADWDWFAADRFNGDKDQAAAVEGGQWQQV